MGEVKVPIHLTNAINEGLVRRGQMASADVRTAQVEALVDTDAVNCVLPPFIANRLGLARPFRQMAEYADGRREEVGVTELVLIEIEGRKVYEECLVLGKPWRGDSTTSWHRTHPPKAAHTASLS